MHISKFAAVRLLRREEPPEGPEGAEHSSSLDLGLADCFAE